MDTVKKRLSEIYLGKPQTYQSLTMFPLLADTDDEPFYLSLGEAILANCLAVKKEPGDRSLTRVNIHSTCTKPVLVLEREVEIGVVENHIFKVCIMLRPHYTHSLPQMCVPTSRWSYTTSTFHGKKETHYISLPRVRRKDYDEPTYENLKNYEVTIDDLAKFWVDHLSRDESSNFKSVTATFTDLQQNFLQELDERISFFSTVDNQCGTLFFIGNSLASLDLYFCSKSLKCYFDKLVAVHTKEENAARLRTHNQIDINPIQIDRLKLVAKKYLNQLKQTDMSQYQGRYSGSEFQLDSEELYGSGLVVDNHLINLVSYPADGKRVRPYDRRINNIQRLMN